MEGTMKAIFISLTIILLSLPAIAEEITVDINRIALLTPPQRDGETESNKIALHFDVPDSLSGKHIVYAEIITDLDFSNVDSDENTSIELQAYTIGSSWTAEEADWNNLADDIDTLNYYTYTFDISSDSKVFMDVTGFIKDIVHRNRDNLGLMLIPHKFDQWAYQIDPSIVSQIGANARLRIIYN
jgi:hypothetical protein